MFYTKLFCRWSLLDLLDFVGWGEIWTPKGAAPPDGGCHSASTSETGTGGLDLIKLIGRATPPPHCIPIKGHVLAEGTDMGRKSIVNCIRDTTAFIANVFRCSADGRFGTQHKIIDTEKEFNFVFTCQSHAK